MESLEIILPGGMRQGSGWRRDAEVRAVCGHDEAFLADYGVALTPAARTTALLSRCVVRLGENASVTRDDVRALTTGDREALLLHLRRATIGERISSVLTCPACGERMDMDLNVADLLLEPYAAASDSYTDSIGEYSIRFRLPTGGDQEALARLARRDLPGAVQAALRACICEMRPGAEEPAAIPDEVARELPARMAQADPQSEIVLDAACPACATAFPVLLDVGEYLYRELGAAGSGLYREAHQLAAHYHWSDGEILNMSRRRRRRFLESLWESGDTGRA